MEFTQAAVNAFKPPKGKADFTVWDAKKTGLGIRFRNGGDPSWVIMYRIGDRQKKMTLGKVAKVPLSEAKVQAGKAFGKLALGNDPASDKSEARAANARMFKDGINEFIGWMEENRTKEYAKKTKLYLNRDFSTLHDTPMARVTRGNIADALDHTNDEVGAVSMNRARSACSKYFNWSIRKGWCEYNPVEHTNRNDETPRDHIIPKRDIKTIWSALSADEDSEYGDIVKLIAFTMQRRTEIGSLPTDCIDLAKRQITISSEAAKNGDKNIIPLSAPAFEIVKRRYDADREFLFGRLDTGFHGWSKAKHAIDEVLGEKVEHWGVHDWRRLGDTVMNEELDIDARVIDSIMNHRDGEGKKGVRKVYNKATYVRKKEEAFGKYAEWLLSIVK